ncbi:MAG: YIP1 family protein [Chlamydiae bacterium]|nr:YIP1 family protein [Chlamydiota bacterium]
MSTNSDLKLWLSIWVKPKETIQKVIAENPDKNLIALSAIYGLSALLGSAQSFALAEKVSFPLLLLGCLILAPFWGYLVFSFASWVIYKTGKWMKGMAEYKHVRAALAWSFVPMAVNLFLWIIMLFVFKEHLLKNFPRDFVFNNFQVNLIYFIFITQLILSIWSIVIFIATLTEVQGYSTLKAIFNTLISTIIIAATFVILGSLLLLILGK